ncbi:hypothetical protein N3934_16580, partial [Acinetobacter baumannii]
SASPPMDVHYRPLITLCKGYLSLFHLSAVFFYYFAKKSDIYGFFLGIFAIFYWFLSLAI